MEPFTLHPVLTPDSSVDFHMHTTYSDGHWPAAQLIDYLAEQGFHLVAVTDHDRVDMVASIQALGEQRNLPVLSGVEMSTEWHGQMGDVLCYGFDPLDNQILPLTEKLVTLRKANTQTVYDQLLRQGYTFPPQAGEQPVEREQLQGPGDVLALLRKYQYANNFYAALNIIKGAGFHSSKVDMGETVEEVHRSGGVCLIAHPGRREAEFTFYSPELLDQVRAEVPIDGIEIYHPTHTPELVTMYQDYARQHQLLQSTGSDSHSIPSRMPIKYRAEISRDLLQRVGIGIA